MKPTPLRTLLALGALALLCGGATAAPVTSPSTNPAGGVYDVRAFGAKGDGIALDSGAIDRAINAAANAGGGTVQFPAGNYLCASVHLKSNVTLYLGSGATVIASGPENGPAYDAPEPNPAAGKYQDFGHAHFHNSLIWGEGLENVSILGPGRIWGRGLIKDEGGAEGRGNKSISLKLCRNVILRDFTIQHGGWFGILATGVDNFTLDNLKIDTNRDGMDIDCCRNVHITDCSVNSPGDDGICLKSSYGLGFARATENVTITGCQVSGFDEGTLLDGTMKQTNKNAQGRIKFGTESNGGFKNITISNCVFRNCRGLALETVDGGLLEDISVSNITMRDVGGSPIFLRLGSRQRGPAGTPVGALRRVNISNIVAYNASAPFSSIISGIPGHAIEDVTLSNIQIWATGGGTKEEAARTPPEKANDYPEPAMFGPTPSYGFYLRHVHGITLNNIQIHTIAPDARTPFVLSDVSGVRVRDTDGVPDTH